MNKKITYILGPSGVGKTTLMKYIDQIRCDRFTTTKGDLLIKKLEDKEFLKLTPYEQQEQILLTYLQNHINYVNELNSKDNEYEILIVDSHPFATLMWSRVLLNNNQITYAQYNALEKIYGGVISIINSPYWAGAKEISAEIVYLHQTMPIEELERHREWETKSFRQLVHHYNTLMSYDLIKEPIHSKNSKVEFIKNYDYNKQQEEVAKWILKRT